MILTQVSEIDAIRRQPALTGRAGGRRAGGWSQRALEEPTLPHIVFDSSRHIDHRELDDSVWGEHLQLGVRLRLRVTTLAIPSWFLLSIAAAVLAFGFNRLALGESWSACARGAYLVVLFVWLGAAIDWAREAVSEVREIRRQEAEAPNRPRE